MTAAVLLVYDIPQRSGARNPSARLRRLGVRVNLSCWVLPEDSVPHQLLDDLTRRGATWHVAPFADAASPAVIKMAVDSLTKEVRRLEASLAKSQETAAGKLDEADARSHAAYQRRVRAALRNAEKVLADSLEGARALGIGEDALPTRSLYRKVEAVRAAAQAKAHLFARAVEKLEDGEVKAAAETAAAPAYVVADALEEQGEDAGELREAFAPADPAPADEEGSEEAPEEAAPQTPPAVNAWLSAEPALA